MWAALFTFDHREMLFEWYHEFPTREAAESALRAQVVERSEVFGSVVDCEIEELHSDGFPFFPPRKFAPLIVSSTRPEDLGPFNQITIVS
jgi:hypothetical protein